MAQHGTVIHYITLWSLVGFFVPTFATIPSIEINSSYLENRQAVGSTVLFNVVSTQVLTFTTINWYFDTNPVAQITSNAMGDLTTNLLNTKYKSRISVSADRNEASEETKKVVDSSLTFGPLESDDSGISIHVEEDTSRSPTFVLNVLNCSYATTQQNSTTDCDFGCTANLTCPNSESVTAVCRANATWSEQLECTQETTTIEPTARIISSTTGQSAVSTESAASNDVSSTTSDNSTGGNKGTPESNGGLSDGAIAGIVIAVVVVVGAGVAGIVIYFKKSGYIPGSAK